MHNRTGHSVPLDQTARLLERSHAPDHVEAVRLAINRFHAHLSAATDQHGQPHSILRPFADHLLKHLLTPSARFTGRTGSRMRAEVSGTFRYEPPEGVSWTI